MKRKVVQFHQSKGNLITTLLCNDGTMWWLDSLEGLGQINLFDIATREPLDFDNLPPYVEEESTEEEGS